MSDAAGYVPGFLGVLTDLGDSALLVPASVLLAVYLFCLGSRRAAATWLSALALCLALTTLSKVAFAACGSLVPVFGVSSPSGHTSLSATFYGCAALMFAGDAERRVQAGVLAAGTALVFVIAATRVLLQVHSLSEVAVGLSIGVASVGWFAGRHFANPPRPVPWVPVVAGIITLAIVMHGWHWQFERLFYALAAFLRTNLSVCT
jgi:membrane-associated phospholipid phosphatase